jgi:hypothetical protein
MLSKLGNKDLDKARECSSSPNTWLGRMRDDNSTIGGNFWGGLRRSCIILGKGASPLQILLAIIASSVDVVPIFCASFQNASQSPLLIVQLL